MHIIGCPACGDSFSASPGYCATCQKDARSSETIPHLSETTVVQDGPFADSLGAEKHAMPPPLVEVSANSAASTIREAAEHQTAVQEPEETEMTIRLPQNVRRGQTAVQEPEETEMTIRLPYRAIQQRAQSSAGVGVVPLGGLSFAQKNASASLEQEILLPLNEPGQEDQDDDIPEHHGTWQKVVGYRTMPLLPMVSAPILLSPQERQVPIVSTSILLSPQEHRVPIWLSGLMGQSSVRSFFWLSTLILVALLLGGAFGVVTSFGSTTVPQPPPTLLASPATIVLGGVVSLRGTHFPPGAKITLSRDAHISLVDTVGISTIQTDDHGLFSDTFVVDPVWLSGAHTLSATDVRTHQQALFPLQVTGQNALQGPPHLVLSSRTLDLGSGDETMNAQKLLAISNAGGSTATWQTSVSQPWLKITPQRGSVASGKHLSVTVAADRATLAPASYQAAIVFTSNTGQVTLTVAMTVTPLQADHEAILKLSSATLVFVGSAYRGIPAEQVLTITNRGLQPLSWRANVSGSRWLWAFPTNGTIPPGGQQRVIVGVLTNNLASGFYRGTITFVNQGSQPIQGSPQSVSVNLIVTPACPLRDFGTRKCSREGIEWR